MAIYRSVRTTEYFIITHVEKNAVIVDGIIGFPMISGCTTIFGYLLQQTRTGHHQVFRNSDDQIYALVRFIRRMVFTRKIKLAASALGSDGHPRVPG